MDLDRSKADTIFIVVIIIIIIIIIIIVIISSSSSIITSTHKVTTTITTLQLTKKKTSLSNRACQRASWKVNDKKRTSIRDLQLQIFGTLEEKKHKMMVAMGVGFFTLKNLWCMGKPPKTNHSSIEDPPFLFTALFVCFKKGFKAQQNLETRDQWTLEQLPIWPREAFQILLSNFQTSALVNSRQFI